MVTRRAAPKNGALRPVRRRNLSQTIAEVLAEEIAQGRLQPGERLRSERELSEAFEVSRSSVREAIKTLQSRGLVEGRQGEGTFVRRQGLDTLVQVPAGPFSVTEAEVDSLFEVRELLEPGIARLAAERARPSDIAALARMLERQERLLESGRYTNKDDTRFHVRLAHITGNPVLIRLEEGIMLLLGDVRAPAFRAAAEGGLKVRLDRHWQILHAIESHDADAAAKAALHHLAGARATAIKVVRELESREGS
jgi:GntR family transcriptional repressor for pyruvate dehydrogenase complex